MSDDVAAAAVPVTPAGREATGPRRRVTPADLALLRECRRSKGAFTNERVMWWTEYRRKGSIRTYRLVTGEHTSEIVTPRVKRLLSMGLIEHDLFIHSNYGPDGDMVLTDAGRAAVDAARSTDDG